MITIINQNVPIYPKCASGMYKRHNMFGVHYICVDQKHIFRVISEYKADNEIMVTDNALEDAVT